MWSVFQSGEIGQHRFDLGLAVVNNGTAGTGSLSRWVLIKDG